MSKTLQIEINTSMRANEFTTPILTESAKPKVGREFQHLEDLIIVNGSKGGLQALQEIAEIVKRPHSTSIKWDGGVGVYWGRDRRGNFMFVPNPQWKKAQPLDRDGLAFQVKTTGRPRANQTPQEFEQTREEMATQYQRLWDIFEAATPKNFRGFLNGDLLFSEPPNLNAQGEYEFTPNKVTYFIRSDGFNNKISAAQVLVVAHGLIKNFGDPATGNLTPVNNSLVDKFNKTPELIVLNAQSPRAEISDNSISKNIRTAAEFVKKNARSIDKIADFVAPRFTTIKQVLYKYSIAQAKNNGKLDFQDWLEDSKLSVNHKIIVADLMKTPEWQTFWAAFRQLSAIKSEVLAIIENQGYQELYDRLGIRAMIGDTVGGEGLIKYSSNGTIGKLVSNQFRSSAPNPKFVSQD